MPSVADVWASPEWYPVAINHSSRRIRFVRMSPDTYRASVFLDSRTRHLGGAGTVGLDDLLAPSCPVAAAVRVHYIFHTGFCCSTLLARYLELLQDVLVLKEPGLLSHVAVTSYDLGEAWNEIATLTLALLSRTYNPSQAVAIKTSDWCNGIAHFLLSANPHASATFLMVPLRSFVLSVLKSAERRRWAHARMRLARHDVDPMSALRSAADEVVTDARAGVFVWLVNAGICKRLQGGPHSSRAGLLDGDELTREPERCLNRIMARSCLPIRADDISGVAASSVSRTYSKDGQREFDAESRSRELAELNRRWEEEADLAVAWARGIDSHAVESWGGSPRACSTNNF